MDYGVRANSSWLIGHTQTEEVIGIILWQKNMGRKMKNNPLFAHPNGRRLSEAVD